MTARIHKSFELLAGLHFNNKYYINNYNIDCTFNVEVESIYEQNIAMDRIKYYLYECLEHCVFVNQNDLETIEKYISVGMRVSTLPEEPYDQIIAIMLLSKLNGVAEGRLLITDITVESNMSDGVSCLHSIEENLGPFYEKGWWNDSTQRINDYNPKNKKIVKLSKTKNEWQEVYLDFGQEPRIKPESAAEIIFTNFEKTDK